MAITSKEIAREKERLPRGWGRFGKSLDHLAEISRPGETLLSSCVGLNPDYKHRDHGPVMPDTIPVGMIIGNILELTETTNAVLALTTERLIIVGTGVGGAPRAHGSVPLQGLQIVSTGKKEFVLRWPEGEMRIRGAAKQQLPEFLSALAARARPPKD